MSANCSECTYLNVDRGHENGKFFCEKKWEYIYADEFSCGRFCRAYSREDRLIKKAEEVSNEYKHGGGCYITTMICNILSMKDNNIYLTQLRNFRDSYLSKNDFGIEILIQYDMVGPKIVKSLINDNGKFNISYTLFNNYIKQAVASILSNDYNKAICIYTDMTNKLMKYYDIDYSKDNSNNFDLKDIGKGHGLVKKYVNTK